MAEQTALFSPADDEQPSHEMSSCGRYRYVLRWPTGEGKGVCLFVLANPSTATQFKLDPTLTRCVDYAKRWGFAWMHVVNVRAWRETNPKLLPPDPLAVGPDNYTWIARCVREAELVVCGYGKLGRKRGIEVLDVIRGAGKQPMALQLNKDGSPQHPLYLLAELKPFPMGAK